MTIQAHAKVNLVLRVLAKRVDGFHEIETLMAPITLADELDVSIFPGTGVEVQCDDPDVPTDADNLVWRAAEVFASLTGLTFRTKIELRKRIPHGAGLAGGSSDAAAVLRALDALHHTDLGHETLERLAAEIGSDIPFFVRSEPAWCRGRGEILEEAGPQPRLPLLLFKPPFPVSTAWAYRHRTHDVPRPPQAVGDLELSNDLEPAVFGKYLLLPTMKTWLLEQHDVHAAMMSGSGSTIFAVLRDGSNGLAARAKARFGESLWTCECLTQGATCS